MLGVKFVGSLVLAFVNADLVAAAVDPDVRVIPRLHFSEFGIALAAVFHTIFIVVHNLPRFMIIFIYYLRKHIFLSLFQTMRLLFLHNFSHGLALGADLLGVPVIAIIFDHAAEVVQ